MIDYYKILNLSFGASEIDIKKRFRKLATIYHPDKNAGSKKSEATFKVILSAYEILADKNKRFDYDIQYRQFFHRTETEANEQNRTSSNTEKKQEKAHSQNNQQTYRQEKQKPTTKPKINYGFWLIVAIVAVLYFYNSIKTKTNNQKTEQQQQQQKPENRPQSGELEF